ncbi:MAG: DUF4843 domain-containing protein [Culturomica sp.]|jgi:hypothetical protein|nr:DUF4843 domain-containing protein [Culturomica sp.]
MKKTILFWAALAVGLSACEQDEIDTFESAHQMVAFTTAATTKTFVGLPDGAKIVVEIPIKVAGDIADTVRKAVFVQANDTVTTLPADKWTILAAEIPAGAWEGVLRMEITKPWAADDTVRKDLLLRVVTADGGDFYAGPESRRHTLTISNKIQPPRTWDSMLSTAKTFSIGFFSPAYYAWIIEETGYTEFPVNEAIPGINLDGNGIPQKWSSAQRTDFLANLTFLLAARNARVGSPLLHDEGDGKGQPVEVGKNIYTPLPSE